ncbi:MAG: LysM peptidoglycan-binding domain-containing protein, partial [Myxococcales bacterium]|nr:LysM peptidoglycan-binding domain-containing protein [Myxococcales bacterium]
MPFASWARLSRAAGKATAKKPQPSAALSVISRSLDGRFERGTLLATLDLRVEVHRDGYVSVPVLPGAVSVTDVHLDGRRATLLAPPPGDRSSYYRVGVTKRGSHHIRATFIAGRSRARFSRRVRLALPAGGTTKLTMTIPELRIRARLRGGAITATSERAGASHVVGYVDGNGQIDLGWTRELDHAARTKTRTSARQLCLYTLADAVARGTAVLDINVLDGETDRFDLRVPRGVEILSVKGRAVLQWRMLEHSGRLAVLLRHLVSGRERVVVRFQAPLSSGSKRPAARDVTLPLLRPLAGVAHGGVVAVQAPAALDVKLRGKVSGQLAARDVPAALAALTRSPLLFGVRLDEKRASLALRLKRRRAVVLARTLVDHLQAATLLLSDGSEVTKLKLSLRNNTRQYLRLRLPSGARLLHVLIDGLVAATSREGDALLVPLRQSERISDKRGRVHVVRDGQTLGDIAHFYYSDPAKWPLILRANRSILRDEKSIQVGQRLRIPSKGPVTVEESSFVIELAYRLDGGALRAAGRRRLRLPGLDVDATRTTWHLYLPRELTPLSFSGDLTQLTAVRYGPLRRALRFFKQVFSTRAAHAGAGKYQSILSQRKRIYRAEARARHGASASPGSFPLLGSRYRFRRLLPARRGLSLEVVYLGATLGAIVRGGCFVLAAALALWVLGARRRRLRHWLAAGGG